MSLRAITEAELAKLDGVRLFGAHAHTGVDIDGTARTSEEHVGALAANRRPLGDLSALRGDGL